MNPFELLAKLREKYSDDDDIQRISAEEERVTALLKRHEYATHPGTEELLALCRRDIVAARRKLATDRSLLTDPEAQRALWFIIDSRAWVIQIVGADYDAEMRRVVHELEAELQR